MCVCMCDVCVRVVRVCVENECEAHRIHAQELHRRSQPLEILCVIDSRNIVQSTLVQIVVLLRACVRVCARACQGVYV